MPCRNFRLRRKRHMAGKCGEAAFVLFILEHNDGFSGIIRIKA